MKRGFIIVLLLLSGCEEEVKTFHPLETRKIEWEEKQPIYDRNDRRAENRYEDVNVNNNGNK